MSADSQPAYWLAVLPWLQLSSEVRLGDVRFVSVEAADPGQVVAELRPVSGECSQVLRSLRLSYQCPINRCTLLIPDRYDPNVPPDDAAQARFYQTTNLLTLAAIAANEYGQHNTWNANASMFSLRIATFTSPPGYLPIYQRRHDGSSLIVGAKWGDPLFYIPDECNPPWPMSVDQRLARALGSLESTHPLAQRLRLSLPFFGWANTLAGTSSWEMEIIALVAALEALLGVGGQYAVACEVRRLLGSHGRIRVRDGRATRPNLRPRGDHAVQQEDWFLHGFLIHELYDIRNDLVHSGFCDTRELTWLPGEHLVMVAFLFPLLVKLLLAQDDRYDPSWEDKAACDAVDMLLARTDWFIRRDGEDTTYSFETPTAWAATLAEAKRQRYSDEADDIARRLWQEHLGVQGSEAGEK